MEWFTGENVDSGRSNFQLDTRSCGRRGNLGYLQNSAHTEFSELGRASITHHVCGRD